jgi:hypothetical protein
MHLIKMTKNKRKTTIWVLGIIITILLIVILFMVGCKPTQQTAGGGNPSSSGGTPGPTVYVHDPCSKCGSYWDTKGWVCSGTCDNGNRCENIGMFESTNPYIKQECTCETQTQTRSCSSILYPTSQRDCDDGTCSTGGECIYHPATIAYTPYCGCDTTYT